MTSRAEKIARMHAEVDRIQAEIDALKNPDVGTVVDEKALNHMRQHGTTYTDALDAVLRANPELMGEFEESFVMSPKA